MAEERKGHADEAPATDGRERISAYDLVADQVRLMGQVARAWCPGFEHLCCDPDDDPAQGPAERLAGAFPDMAVIRLHDRPYEVTMPDGSALTVDEGKGSHPGVYLPSAGDGGCDVIHCATSGRLDNVHRRRHFTMLHEIGHMVQNRDRSLARRLRTQRVMDRYRFEERCCNEFAARSLLPDGLMERYVDWPFAADDVAALYEHSFASREVVAYHVVKLMPVPGIIKVRNSRTVAKSLMLLKSGEDWPQGPEDAIHASSCTWFKVSYSDDPELVAKLSGKRAHASEKNASAKEGNR